MTAYLKTKPLKFLCTQHHFNLFNLLVVGLFSTVLMIKTADAQDSGLLDRLHALESDIDWQEPDLAASWTVYDSYQPFMFGKTNDGLVILTGMMSGCASREAPIFVLPVGYRPPKTQIFTVAAVRGGGISIGHLYVHVDGRVIFFESYQSWGVSVCNIENRPASSWMSLAGVVFPSIDSLKQQ